MKSACERSRDCFGGTVMWGRRERREHRAGTEACSTALLAVGVTGVLR